MVTITMVAASFALQYDKGRRAAVVPPTQADQPSPARRLVPPRGLDQKIMLAELLPRDIGKRSAMLVPIG